jgi:hypothetical protein
MLGKIYGLEQRFPSQRTVSKNMEELVIHLTFLSVIFFGYKSRLLFAEIAKAIWFSGVRCQVSDLQVSRP